MITFEPFPKIPRLVRECIITEKIDGTNAQIIITEEGEIGAASRNRLITPEDDNYGFAKWVQDNKEDLMQLGVGRHFGEWWGQDIQRGYGLEEKRFSLFNVVRWRDGRQPRPDCCHVVPLLWEGYFSTDVVENNLKNLREWGSFARPLYPNPEGVVIYHKASGGLFKQLLENDSQPKGLNDGIRN